MGVDDGKQVNIPAPPKFNLGERWMGEESPTDSGGLARGRGGFGQSGFLNHSAKKSPSVQ